MHEDPPPYRIGPAAAPFRFIDLFCGIGGFRIAFEKAGGRCVFSSDWDKYSRQTYEANFGEEPHGDIHSVAVADILEQDILCGGFVRVNRLKPVREPQVLSGSQMWNRRMPVTELDRSNCPAERRQPCPGGRG